MGSLRFKSWTGHIRHTIVNGSPRLRQFFERSCVVCRRNDAVIEPANSLHASAQYSEYNIDYIFLQYQTVSDITDLVIQQ